MMGKIRATWPTFSEKRYANNDHEQIIATALAINLYTKLDTQDN